MAPVLWLLIAAIDGSIALGCPRLGNSAILNATFSVYEIEVRSMNRAMKKVLAFDDEHPAKLFVAAFEACRYRCVGRDIDWPEQPAVDQCWASPIDGREWKFSQFAYIYLSYTLNPQEWLDENNHPQHSPGEASFIESLPRVLRLLNECQAAAAAESNPTILGMIDECRQVFQLQKRAIDYRLTLARERVGN